MCEDFSMLPVGGEGHEWKCVAAALQLSMKQDMIYLRGEKCLPRSA